MSATARTTGWAAIAYAIIYIGTFVSNILLGMLGPASGVRYRTPDQMAADLLGGDVGAMCFALLGAALIVVAIGLRRLIWGDESIAGAAASSVGVIAGAGLMLAGAAIGAQRGFAANDLAATGADLAMQRAVVQGGSLLVNAATFLASLALLIWLSSVAIVARRERTFSAPLIAATWLTALAPFASVAVTGYPPFGLIVTIPYAAALGISLVRRGRRLAATAAAATAPAASAA
jgi:hypothetical protein